MKNEPCDESNYVERVYLPEPCTKEVRTVRTFVPWGRFRMKCDALIELQGSVSAYEIAMRRKAEVLQYKHKHTGIIKTKKAQFAQAVNSRKMSAAKLVRLREPCGQHTQRIEAPASASDVPGGGMLWLDTSVPYIPIGHERRPAYSTDEGDYI